MEYIFQNKPLKYLQDINVGNFKDIALQAFNYQYVNNEVYHSFVNHLHVDVNKIEHIVDIPFLPVSFYKTHQVVAGTVQNDTKVFSSSTTTSDIAGKHFVKDIILYEQSLLQGFQSIYGAPSGYTILALLPSYLQRSNASLVHMAQVLMDSSGHKLNGFYLDEYQQLYDILQQLEAQKQPTLLLGVTFALLDFAEQFSMNLKHTIVMETGGMKGRRREMTRLEVHELLKERLGVERVHSEYGMTELLSQAYSVGEGIYTAPTTMQVLVRDVHDPFEIKTEGTGCINIIDLANVHSCSFIATDDIGRIYADGSFEVLGRVDNSALRGCNLMVV